MNTKDKLAYTRREAAEALGYEITTINRAVRAGDLRETYPRVNGEPLKKGVILADELRRWASDAA